MKTVCTAATEKRQLPVSVLLGCNERRLDPSGRGIRGNGLDVPEWSSVVTPTQGSTVTLAVKIESHHRRPVHSSQATAWTEFVKFSDVCAAHCDFVHSRLAMKRSMLPTAFAKLNPSS